MSHEADGGRKVLVNASVASMLDLFNRENFKILQEAGCQVEVAANFSFGNITSPKRVAQFCRELEEMGIAVYDVPIPRKVTDIPNILRSYQMLKRLCDQNNYCLIHTQSPIGGAVCRMAVAKSRKESQDERTRVIYTAHGFHFYHGAPLHRWLLFYPIEKWLSAYTDTLITINMEDYRQAMKFSASRVCWLPGIGIHLEDFYPDAKKRDRLRQRFGFRKRDFVVLSVGQLSKRKNQEIIIRAMGLLKDMDIRYVIVGLGEQGTNYRKLIKKLGLERNVFLVGYRDDVQDLLQMADCFAFPSLQEGLPVALMEAMAAGVPVVCSQIRGNCDLIRDGVEGRILKPHDKVGFAHAMLEIMEHPQLADKYRKHAWERVCACSAERVNDRMRKIYGRYLSDRDL